MLKKRSEEIVPSLTRPGRNVPNEAKPRKCVRLRGSSPRAALCIHSMRNNVRLRNAVACAPRFWILQKARKSLYDLHRSMVSSRFVTTSIEDVAIERRTLRHTSTVCGPIVANTLFLQSSLFQPSAWAPAAATYIGGLKNETRAPPSCAQARRFLAKRARSTGQIL